MKPPHKEPPELRRYRFHTALLIVAGPLALLSSFPKVSAYIPPLLWVAQGQHLGWFFTLPLALLGWRLGARWATLLLLIVSGLWITSWVTRVTAEASTEPVGSRDGLRVVSWNVANDLVERKELQSFIEECDSDIIALQELSPGKATWLESVAIDLYPHRSLHGLGKGGLGLLSRHSLEETDLFYLAGEWPHLRAKVMAPEQSVTVITMHPRALLAFLGAWQPAHKDFEAVGEMCYTQSPSLLMGDLNTSERTLPYRTLRDSGWVDAYRSHSKALGFTFPVWRRFHGIPSPPIARIDYIFHTPDLRTTHCWIGEDGASDHLPLYAEFEWP